MVSYRFSNGNPPPDLEAHLQSLNSFSVDQLNELVAFVLDFLTQQGTSDLVEGTAAYSAKHGVNQVALKNILSGLLYFFKEAIKSNITPAMIKEDLGNFGIGDEKVETICTLWKQKFASLSKAAMSTTLMVNQIVDLEWKFGVTAANNDLGKAGASYLQMKFVLDKGNEVREDVHMELTLSQFYQFLQEMQKAKANLELFSFK